MPRSPGGEPTPTAVCSPPSRLWQDSNILRRNLTDGAGRRQYIRHTRLESKNEGGDDTFVDRKGEPRRAREGLVRRVTLLSGGEALTGTINGTDKPHTGG